MKLVCEACGRMYGRKFGQLALSDLDPEARTAAQLTGWFKTATGWNCGLAGCKP